jgi:hypothetical protein
MLSEGYGRVSAHQDVHELHELSHGERPNGKGKLLFHADDDEGQHTVEDAAESDAEAEGLLSSPRPRRSSTTRVHPQANVITTGRRKSITAFGKLLDLGGGMPKGEREQFVSEMLSQVRLPSPHGQKLGSNPVLDT